MNKNLTESDILKMAAKIAAHYSTGIDSKEFVRRCNEPLIDIVESFSLCVNIIVQIIDRFKSNIPFGVTNTTLYDLSCVIFAEQNCKEQISYSEYVPEIEKGTREITADDIINIKILLETTEDVLSFIEKV